MGSKSHSKSSSHTTVVYSSVNSACLGPTCHHQVDQECKIMYTVIWKLRSHILKISEYFSMLSVYNIKEQP